MTWNDFTSWVSDKVQRVENFFNTIYTDAKDGVSAVFHSIDSTRSAIVNSATKISEQIVPTVGGVVKDVTGTVNNLGKDVVGISSNLQMPLMLGGAGVLAYLLLKK